MNRFWLELRLSSGCLNELGGLWEIKVNELPAIVADCVVVTASLPVVTAGAVAKLNLMYKSRFLQKPERVVYGCITNGRQAQTRRLKDLVRARVIFPFTNNLKNRLPLRR